MADINAQVPEEFDLRDYFGNAWAVYRGEQSFDVEIRFAKEVAATVVETVWHHTQKVQKNQDGTVTFTFRVDGLNEIVRWVLGWGSRAVVIKPPELRQLILGQLQEAAEAYKRVD